MDYDVSVIVPIYNMEAHVEAGVNALRAQTCPRMQVVLVNDGSKDDSEAVTRKAIEGLEHFKLISTPNRGSGPARNTGIQNASGKYLYFFDIDDRLEPNAIERMVALAEEAQCDLMVFSFTHTKDFSLPPKTYQNEDATAEGEAMRMNFQRYMERPTNVTGAPWNKLFRRDVVLEHGLEYPPLRRHQDEGFLMRYAAVARTVRFSKEVLYHHLYNDQARRWMKYPKDYGDIVEQLIDLFEQIVIAWNPQNDAVRQNVLQIYYERNLDVLKMLFNPKWGYSHSERYRALKARQDTYAKRRAKYTGIDVRHDRYYGLIQGGHSLLLYCALWVRIQRNQIKKS